MVRLAYASLLVGYQRADTAAFWYSLGHHLDWSFVGVLVAVAFGSAMLVLGLFQYKKSRGRRRLTYTVTTSPLAQISARHGDQVEVRYKGEKVSAASLIGVHLENAGDEPIRSTDFESPICISLGDSARVLTVDVIEKFAADVRPTVRTAAPAIVELEPMLLNPGERVRLLILVEGAGDTVVAARVVGIQELEAKAGPPTVEKQLRRVLAVIFGLGLLPGLFAALFDVHDAALRQALLLQQGGYVLGVCFGGAGAWLYASRRVRQGKWLLPEE